MHIKIVSFNIVMHITHFPAFSLSQIISVKKECNIDFNCLIYVYIIDKNIYIIYYNTNLYNYTHISIKIRTMCLKLRRPPFCQ